jgi:nitrogen regulatory protein P-II 1
MMKRIQAIIRTTKFEEVRLALHAIGVEFFTYYDVKGVSFQNDNKGSYRGALINESTSIPRRAIDIVVPEIDAQDVIKVIQKNAATGTTGDGKIYMSDINESFRIS